MTDAHPSHTWVAVDGWDGKDKHTAPWCTKCGWRVYTPQALTACVGHPPPGCWPVRTISVDEAKQIYPDKPERFDRASWDIPTSFSPRMGTLAT